MNETEFEDAVVDLAHRFGWVAAGFRPARTAKGWRTPCKHDATGWPDVVFVHAEHQTILFVEFKTARGTRTPEQVVWGDHLTEATRCAAAYGYDVWRPADSDRIATILTFGRVTTWNL